MSDVLKISEDNLRDACRSLEKSILEHEPPLGVKCHECGLVYSLHMHTVCPRCFAWPKLKEPR